MILIPGDPKNTAVFQFKWGLEVKNNAVFQFKWGLNSSLNHSRLSMSIEQL